MGDKVCAAICDVSNVMIEYDMCCDTRHQVMSQLITSLLPSNISQILQLSD